MKVSIRRGEVIPYYFGVAYYDHERDTAVCYPIPFNLIVSVFHYFKFWLKNRFAHWLDSIMKRDL